MAKKPNKIVLDNEDNVRSFGKEDDKVLAKGGNDEISGGGGNDILKGGDGNDVLKGGNGNDKLIGGKGDDILLGGKGDDILNAKKGNDSVDGGKGDDTVVLSGNFADAQITKEGDAFKIVTAEGTTIVKNVELFRFADKIVEADDLIAPSSDVFLTEKADNVTGNKIFAPRGFTPGGTDQVNTLNDDDIINGTGPDATLTVEFVNDADTGDLDIQATINDIANIITNVRADMGGVIDLQDSSGVDDGAGGKVFKNLEVRGVDDFGFFTYDNIQHKVETLTVKDSNAPNGGVAFLFDNDAVSGADDSTKLALDDAELSFLAVTNESGSLGVGIEHLAVDSKGDNGIDELNVEDVEDITITGDGDLRLGASEDFSFNDRVEAVIYSAGLSSVAGSLKKVDASGLTGDLEINLGAEVVGALDDTSGVDVDFEVTGGGGNDTIRLLDGFDSKGDKVDGGAGDNTLQVFSSVTNGSITQIQHLDVRNQNDTTLGDVKSEISIDASLFSADLKDITVRNEGFFSGLGNNSESTIVLNKLTADLAKNVKVLHSTTNSNGLNENVVVVNLATNTAADLVAVTIKDGTNSEPRFNLDLTTAGVENITINDLDTESNTVFLGADGIHSVDKDGGSIVSDITGTVTLTGGSAGKFLNLDVDAVKNFYGFAVDGSAKDGTGVLADQKFFGVGQSVFDANKGLGLTASKIDASTYLGDVVVRVFDAEDSKGAETATGGQSILMGKGNDTVIFDDANDIHAGLTISDTVSGGDGSDTLAIEGTDGTKIVIGASEWTNVTGFETIRLTGTGGPGNAGNFGTNDYNLVLTNELIDKNGVGGKITIINDNNLSDENPATDGQGVAALNQQQRGVTIDARSLNASHSFIYNGAEGVGEQSKDRFILTDATINGAAIINGGYAVFGTTARNDDVLEARNASQVTIGDLANVSNVGTLSFTNDTAAIQTSTLELNTATIDALVNSSHDAKAGAVETLIVNAEGSLTVVNAATIVNVDLTNVDFTKTAVNFASSGGTTKFNITGLDLATEAVTFNGGAGADTFTGGAGNDTINGGAGADTLTGGLGNDTINVGAGDGAQDFVIFNSANDGIDTIIGFSAATDGIGFGGALRTALDDNGNGTFQVFATNGFDGFNQNINVDAFEFVLIPFPESDTVNTADFENLVLVAAEFNEELNLVNASAGDEMLLALQFADNAGTAFYLWTNIDSDADVDANELTVLGRVNGVGLTTANFVFV